MGKIHSSGTDLTEGVIWKQVLLFFLPVFLGSLFQQLYTATDAVIIGHFAGKEALASIESTTVLCRMFVNFFVGVSSGATVVISQYFGAKRSESLSDAIHTAMAFAIAAGAFISVVCTVLTPNLLEIMNIPPEIKQRSITYARVFFSGSLVSLIYNMGTGILRAIGDSRTPFKYLVVSCILNIILDCLFVIVFKWGVFGVAIATVIAQGVSAVLILAKLHSLAGPCRMDFRKLRFNGTELGKIIKVGLPIGLQGLAYSATNIIIQSTLNAFGTDTIASWGIYGKIDSLVWMILEGFGIASSTFVAQNYGAGKTDRVRKSIGTCLRLSVAFSAGYGILLVFLSRYFAMIFITDENVIDLCCWMVSIIAPFYWTYSFSEVLSGAIRGTGQSIGPMLLTMVGTCLFRIIWMFTVVPNHPNDLLPVVVLYPITWILTSLMFIAYYFHRRRAGLI
ncbi:MAG: MATE family efflux transporter [Sphaerochaetaceae bacterium]|nr:MATE family efflux transporter [Sphaerochaetaceae bacterium]MDD4006662.1 MATE family efflux transporter [Sphaerochaetaceae bacterium]MDD4396214.1 MATE family efflux transporter [Sphaerochaetaceae bacterium]